jgi:uncharacterized protein (UPF0333 family)
MPSLHDLFDGLKDNGPSYVILLVLATIVFYFIKKQIKEFMQYAENNTKALMEIYESNMDKATKRLIKRCEIINKIDEVKKDCTEFDCPFQQNMLSKMEEFVWNSERLEKTFSAWKENSGRINDQINTTLAAATEDMRRVNHELLSLVRSVIERSTNGKREVSE